MPFGNLANPAQIGCTPTEFIRWIMTGYFVTGSDVKGYIRALKNPRGKAARFGSVPAAHEEPARTYVNKVR